MAPKKNASKPHQRPNPPRATASGRISKPRRRLGENPPPPVAAAIPEEDQWDEEEPVEGADPVPAAMASLEQLHQLEASIDERFEQLDTNFQNYNGKNLHETVTLRRHQTVSGCR